MRLKPKLANMTCVECESQQEGQKKKRKKTGGKLVHDAWVCLFCCEVLCQSHSVEHDSKHYLMARTTVKQVHCLQCGKDIAESFEKNGSELDPDYARKLQIFLNDVWGAIGLKDSEACELLFSESETAPPTDSPSIQEEDLGETVELVDNGKMKELASITKMKGLSNLGNTCYFNSVMQCLNATDELVELILTKSLPKPSPTPLSLRSKLKQFFVEIREKAGICYNPTVLLNGIRGKASRFRGFTQQDSHELLMTILDKLIDEEQKYIKQVFQKEKVSFMDTSITQLFGSHLANRVHCLGCDNDYWVFDPCTIYSLPMSCKRETYVFRNPRKVVYTRRGKEEVKKKTETIKTIPCEEEKRAPEMKVEHYLEIKSKEPKFNKCQIKAKEYLVANKQMHKFVQEEQIKTITDCLSFFFNQEVLSPETKNAYACPQCTPEGMKGENPKAPKAIREYFICNPPRILVLHLKRFSGMGLFLRKNTKRIEVPFKLSLENYLLFTTQNLPAEELAKLENYRPSDKLNIFQYELYGIVSHSGGMGGGHYIAYVKRGEQWYHVSDSRFSESSTKKVSMAEAYIAFYRQVILA